jgi:predicted RNase H-like HicB family nuclease
MSQDVSSGPAPRNVEVTATVPALVFPEPQAGGYSAEVPALPGCYAQGETLAEVQANLREAIEGWVAAAHDEALAQAAEKGDAA